VRFVDAAPEVNPQVDAAYHLKYDRYGPQIVGTGVGPAAAAVTLGLRTPTATNGPDGSAVHVDQQGWRCRPSA